VGVFVCTAATILIAAQEASSQSVTAATIAAPGETPVPVTVITDTMIEDIGARNLKEVLVTYVPGMTFSQDHNEVNVAMRGVFASSQQKFLITINGHVLNSRSLGTANPDFGIALDNVKRIEVLRGPASSVYGPGALTAVVNLVTKTSADINEGRASVGVGNFGQVKLTGLFGGRTNNSSDVTAWGTLYRSSGDTVAIPARQDYSRTPADSEAILEGVKGPPSHDVGLTLKTGSFSLFAAHRRSRSIEPFSSGGPTGESYRYTDYQPGDGVEPGFSMQSFNIDVGHERTIGDLLLAARGYADRTDITAHVISDPSAGAHSLVRWKDWDAGAVGQVSGSRSVAQGDARWTAGAQLDYLRVDDSVLTVGTGGGWNGSGPTGGLLELGREYTGSGFFRIAYPLGPTLNAHGGVRYDHKTRHEGDGIDAVSPHVVLTYAPNERSSATVSYSRGFVDAPYWYRHNSLPSYRGSRDLKPEYLTSFQVTPASQLTERVAARLNLFFNSLDDLVWRNKNAAAGEPTYQNAGFLKTWGIEPEVSYSRTDFVFDVNLTYQRVRDAENYDVADGKIHNVPSWSWNAVATYRPEAFARHDLRGNLTVRYIGKQLSPVNVTIGNSTFVEPDRTVDAVTLLNAGLRAGTLWSTRWFLDFRVFNVLDYGFEQGGSVPHPYPQPGRSVLVQVGRRF
jgi:iron complex outermembrane receptor protein